jgi:chromosome segregation ATPase
MRELRETPPGLLELEPDLAATFESESLGPEVYRQRAARSRQELSELTLPEHEINEELYERQRQTVQRMMDEVEQMRGRAQEYRGLFETALAEFRRHVEYLFNVAIARHFREYCRAARARASLEVSGDDQDHWVMLVRVGYNDKDPEPLETARLSQGEKVVTGLFIVLAALRAVDAAPLLVLDEFLGTLDDVNATLVFQRLREAGAQSFIASPHVRPRVYALADTLWQFSPRREGEPLAPPVAAEDRRRPVAL